LPAIAVGAVLEGDSNDHCQEKHAYPHHVLIFPIKSCDFRGLKKMKWQRVAKFNDLGQTGQTALTNGQFYIRIVPAGSWLDFLAV
jgi:hypothetical protein